jgi:Tfp pilus assembly protein PilN
VIYANLVLSAVNMCIIVRAGLYLLQIRRLKAENLILQDRLVRARALLQELSDLESSPREKAFNRMLRNAET